MIFDTDRMYRDLKKHQYQNALSQNELVNDIGISRHTLYRLSKGKEITMSVFLKLLTWTKNDVTRYIKKEENETTPQHNFSKTN
jgi:DNA-binding Xre family transcriptional regulator